MLSREVEDGAHSKTSQPLHQRSQLVRQRREPQRRPQRADVPQERHHRRSRARARPQIARTRAALDQNASFAKRVVSQFQQSRAFEPTGARASLSLSRALADARARSFARSFVRARDPFAPRSIAVARRCAAASRVDAFWPRDGSRRVLVRET
jgi:hypothetical protein